MKIVSKPVELEAIQWTGFNEDEICKFVGVENWELVYGDDLSILVPSCHDSDICFGLAVNDYLVKDMNEDFHACTHDMFKRLYEIVEE